MGELKFYISSIDDILSGEATDIYFKRSREIVKAKGLEHVKVRMEVHAYSLPKGYEWGVFAGLEEALKLLEGKPFNVWSVDEGTIFKPYMPLMVIEGSYADFSVYETPLLGILRHATSIATKAARIKKLAGDKTVLFFGLRAVHPAIFPMVDRAAYIGGCDGVSGALAEKFLGLEPKGTMPHALILVFGSQVEAWKAFDEIMPPHIPRIALADTLSDERYEAILAAQTLKDKLYGVRFDTPRSRRGNMREIVVETRWTLDIQGYKHVKIFVSGGIGEAEVYKLRDVVDGFGVGTTIATPHSIDLSVDIVEVNRGDGWKPISKKGKIPGFKQAYRCNEHILEVDIKMWGEEAPLCNICRKPMEPLLKKYIEDGKLIVKPPSINEIRDYVLKQLSKLPEIKVLV